LADVEKRANKKGQLTLPFFEYNNRN
jgi:hypothetical protein